MHSAAI